MLRASPSLLVAMAAFAGLGCGEELEANPPAQGTVGESCEAAHHCASDLRCIDRVCVADGVLGGQGSADGGTAAGRGEVGETCKRRADCQVGLRCADRTCIDLDGPVAATADLGLGQRLESCVARNDCVSGLACIAGVCIEADYVLSMAEGECMIIECAEAEDCCAIFVPLVPQTDCDNYNARCTDGSPSAEFYCAAYRTNCECRQVCEDQRCVSDLTCVSDDDCGANGVLTCHGGRCLQCASDAQCGGDEICQDNACRPGCERDENCGAFSTCERGRCTDASCISDRDCQFATGNLRSLCIDGVCDTPCNADRECPTFDACIDESCVFIGCDSAEECRAHLGLNDLPPGDTAQAACVAPQD